MATKHSLQTVLEGILGSRNVYFQTPTKLHYPCILYKLADIKVEHADNMPYNTTKRYQITLIHEDPDNTVLDELMKLPTAKFNTHYAKDDLNHYVLFVYY